MSNDNALTARIYRLKKLLKADGMTITAKDKAMFHDLSKVGVLSQQQVKSHHNQSNERLDKLAKAGFLKRHVSYDRKKGRVISYSFPSKRVAQVFNGFCPKLSNRTMRHELLVSEAYFHAGKPTDFKVESRFDGRDHDLFDSKLLSVGQKKEYFAVEHQAQLPDAIFTNGAGDTVVVEADAGNYNRTQIDTKLKSWQGMKQLWVQPSDKNKAIVPTQNNVELIKI